LKGGVYNAVCVGEASVDLIPRVLDTLCFTIDRMLYESARI
jgi:hypothetical protein